MYIVMIVFLLVLLVWCYIGFKREIFYPPVMVVLMFFFCSFLGLIRYEDWRISEYSIKTVAVILTGVMSFLFAGYLVYRLYPRKVRKEQTAFNRQRIEVPILVSLFAIGAGALHLLLFYNYIHYVVRAVGYNSGSLSAVINSYYYLKNSEIYFRQFGGVSRILKILNIVTSSFAVFFLFVFVHNICFRQFKTRDFLCMAAVMFRGMYSLLNSNRGEFLVLLAQIIYLLYFFWNMRTGRKLKVNSKIVKWGVGAFILFVGVFLILTVALGRRKSFSELNALDYITIYTSSGLRNIDLFLQPNVPRNEVFGKETFYPLNRMLYSAFGIGAYYPIGLEYNSINGKNIGNIYTAFRRYYADFGYLGVVVLPFSLGLLYCCIFKKIQKRMQKGEIGYMMLLFSTLSSSVFYFPIEDHFFIYDLTVSRLVEYVFMYFLYIMIVNKRVRMRFSSSQ